MGFLVVIVIAFFIAIIIGIAKNNEEEEKKRLRAQKRAEEKKAKEEAKEQKYQIMLQKLPEADVIVEHDYDKYVMLKESSSQIMLNDHVYSFGDILDYSVSDNQTVIQRSSGGTATTKTSTGSMLGRAVVGGVLTGGVGAAVGAATARKETEISQGNTYSTTKHSYTINVTINSLTSPIETLAFHNDEEATNKVISILTVILHRNEHNQNARLIE